MDIETFNKKCDEIEDGLKRLQAENDELRKDKERLDRLQSSDLTLHSWGLGEVWGSKGAWTIREFIDEMEEEQ